MTLSQIIGQINSEALRTLNMNVCKVLLLLTVIYSSPSMEEDCESCLCMDGTIRCVGRSVMDMPYLNLAEKESVKQIALFNTLIQHIDFTQFTDLEEVVILNNFLFNCSDLNRLMRNKPEIRVHSDCFVVTPHYEIMSAETMQPSSATQELTKDKTKMEIQVGSVNVLLEMELPIILGSILGFAAIVSAVGIGYFLFKKWKRNQA